MPSPFPGMNPYLGRPDGWQDFHDSFIPKVREVLSAQVRPRYYIRIEENLYIHEPPARKRPLLGQPDVSVHPSPGRPAAPAAGGAAVAAPARVGMPFVLPDERVPYLEIRDRDRHETVTVLELLSPVNKGKGKKRDQYLAKVERVLASGTNFVEIDLLRGGPRMPWDGLPPCDYYAVVSRPAGRRLDTPVADLWPIGLRDPLPKVPVPLREGEAEAEIDLKAVLDAIYDAADYGLYIYLRRPEPRLRPDDAAWAREILAAAGITAG